MVKALLIAGLGGFVGTVFRFLITRYIQVTYLSVFPWGTFVVNILGSLLIGVFFGISEKGDLLSPEWRIFLTVGICGGFTTFASLSHDAFLLLQNKEWLRFIIYPTVSFFLGLVAVFLGRALITMVR
ncbi:MAG: fluoride efflux transporter CrcB [Marinilabilia sp.]